MKLVEKMARAIYGEFESNPEYARQQMNGLLASDLALAALRAMREPSEAMLKVGGGAFYGSKKDVLAARLPETFTAMIDTAIQEAEAK